MLRFILGALLIGGICSGSTSVAPAASAASVSIDPQVEYQIAATGRARVLVELLAVADSGPREDLIARAQTAVLSAMPPTSYVLVRRYTSIPLLALEIDGDGLRALRAMSGLVAAVKPDLTMRPQ